MVIMINMSEEWRKSILESHGVEILDEISKELETKAFANRATRAFEMDDTEESGKADKTKDRIVKKYGKKSGDEAEKAAERGIFGHNKYSEAQEREKAKKKVTKEELQAWVDQLIAEGYDLSEYTLEEVAEIYAEELQLMELTGGKGHPGYKAGSKDHGPMQSGHPADTFKRTMKGGTMSMRHGDHLGDLDDDDDEEDDLEAGLKDTARKKRENVRKPLRDKVKAVRKAMTKEEMELD